MEEKNSPLEKRIEDINNTIFELEKKYKKKRIQFYNIRNNIQTKLNNKTLSYLNIGDRNNRINYMKISKKDDEIQEKMVTKSIFSLYKRKRFYETELKNLNEELKNLSTHENKKEE